MAARPALSAIASIASDTSFVRAYALRTKRRGGRPQPAGALWIQKERGSRGAQVRARGAPGDAGAERYGRLSALLELGRCPAPRPAALRPARRLGPGRGVEEREMESEMGREREGGEEGARTRGDRGHVDDGDPARRYHPHVPQRRHQRRQRHPQVRLREGRGVSD